MFKFITRWANFHPLICSSAFQSMHSHLNHLETWCLGHSCLFLVRSVIFKDVCSFGNLTTRHNRNFLLCKSNLFKWSSSTTSKSNSCTGFTIWIRTRIPLFIWSRMQNLLLHSVHVETGSFVDFFFKGSETPQSLNHIHNILFCWQTELNGSGHISNLVETQIKNSTSWWFGTAIRSINVTCIEFSVSSFFSLGLGFIISLTDICTCRIYVWKLVIYLSNQFKFSQFILCIWFFEFK